MRVRALYGILTSTALVGIGLLASGRADAQSPTTDKTHGIVGAWTLNKDLSDQPQDRGQQGDDNSNGGRPDGGMRRGGGFGRGGRGGGFGGGGGGYGGGGAGMSPEDMQRMRDARREIMNAPDRITIAQTESLILVTNGDGRVTRLSPDGKKIKDESTKIERKTKWDGDKLVSEITGLGPSKITETYVADREHKQLRVTLQMDTRGRPMTVNRVYDAGTE